MIQLLAVDIGGPIIQRPAHSTLEEYAQAEAVADSFSSLAYLHSIFGENIHLISQCQPDLQEVKLKWMEEKNFCHLTKVPLKRIHFVREPHEKALLAKELKATHFVEDRAEILNHAMKVVENLFLFRPNLSEALNYPALLKNCRVVLNWDSLVWFITLCS